MNLVALLVSLLLVAATCCFALRFPIRHMSRNLRTPRIGDFNWFELVDEGALRGDGRPNLSGVRAISESIKSGWPHLNRRVATLVWANDASGTVHLYLGITAHDESDVTGAAQSLAKSIGCRLRELAEAPDIPTEGLMLAVRDRVTAIQAKDKPSMDGAVASGVADQFEHLPRGERAAFIVTLDAMRNTESRRLEGAIVKYSHQRSGDEASQMKGMDDAARIMTTDAVRSSIAATNSRGDHQLSERILRAATSGISTLGYSLQYASPDRAHGRAAVAFGVLGLAPTVLLTLSQAIHPALGVILALVQLAVVVAAAISPEFSSGRWFREALQRGEVVVPAYTFFSLRYWLASRHDLLTRFALPSCRQVISLYPAPLYEIARFPADDSNMARANASGRGLPKVMLDVEEGIYMGQDGLDQPVLMDLMDLSYSFYTAGAPNSGKTNLLQVIFAGTVDHSMRRTLGMTVCPIWGETKGEGAYEAWEIAKHHPQARFIDVHNPHATGRAGYRFAFEGRRLSEGASVQEVNGSALALVNAMQYAWGDGIRSASKDVLRNAVGLSMLLDADDIAYLELDGVVDPDAPNLMDLAYYLLGGDTSITPAGKLMKLKEQLDAKSDERDFYIDHYIGQLSRTIGDRRANSAALDASLNKLGDLREAKLAWVPSETKQSVYVADLVDGDAPVVLNMGPYRMPGSTSYASAVSDTVSQRMTRMALRLLWSHIKANCSGWQAQGKRIPLFFDEVADIASGGQNDDTENVVEQAMKEGRSRGLALFLGCQSPSQMPPSVRMQVLGARSKFWFNLHNTKDLAMATEDLSSGGVDLPYSQQHLRAFENGTCAGIMRRTMGGKGTVTPPFTLHVPLASKWAEALFDNRSVHDALVDYEAAMERALV